MSTPLTDQLHALGEHLAAGFLELPNATPLERMARGVRRQLERAAPPVWRGEPLFPSGAFSWYDQGAAITFHYSHSLRVNHSLLESRCAGDALNDAETYCQLRQQLGDYPQVGAGIDPDISLGGANYTHSILNYGRIAREGLAAYAERLEARLVRAEQSGHAEQVAFYRALRDTLSGILAALGRSLAVLQAQEPSGGEARATWERLVAALERVPWEPARTFYEALVAANWLYYMDGCDNVGRFDQDLGPWFESDLEAGRLDYSDSVAWVRQLWTNVDANTGWNVAIGGTGSDGSSTCNRLTLACLEAARGRRRPNLALRLAENTPEEVWDAALDCIATGCGIPALYNESLYLRAIREAHLNVAQDDLHRYAFGGCTELMIHGCSNVGSLDAGLNLPLILSRTLREHLAQATGFEALLGAYDADVRATVRRLAEQVSRAQEQHALHQPQPIRTLFVDDCLDAGVEFNAGGARYNWSVVNVGGLANVADSLQALREAVYERGEVDGARVLAALDADYAGAEALRQRLSGCAHYGNDDPRVDALAERVAHSVFEELRRYAPWRGGRFVPGCLMFVTYAAAGEQVMATPDGRLAGEPIADSIGAVQGRDRRGPTALICSTARIPQHLAPGTLVTNVRFAKRMFQPHNRERLKELVRSYFRLGGLQMQITVVDQETLRDAVAHPERHGDLIVRIGGYSEYWRNLSQSLRQSVLERTEHNL